MGCDIHPYIEVNSLFLGKRDPEYPWWRLRKEAYIAVKDLDKDDPQYAELARKAFDTWRAEMNKIVTIPLRQFIGRGSEDFGNIFGVMEEMERVKPKDGTDDDVRLVFWFDN